MKKVLLSLAVAVAVVSIAPITAQAQFGGLGKLKGAMDKAKNIKNKADTAKAVMDAAKAAKGAMSGAAAQMSTVTEESYAKFGKGVAAEKAAWTANKDAEAAVKAALEASGLDYKDYNSLKTKVFSYYGAIKNPQAAGDLASAMYNADEAKVLESHKAEIIGWVESAGWAGQTAPAAAPAAPAAATPAAPAGK